jgi:hypothetical protein
MINWKNFTIRLYLVQISWENYLSLRLRNKQHGIQLEVWQKKDFAGQSLKSKNRSTEPIIFLPGVNDTYMQELI